MKRFLKWFGIVAGGLIILIIILAAVFGSNDKEQSTPTQQKTSTEKSVPSPTPTPTFDELKAKAISVEYKELFRNNENYVGKLVYFRGQVVQVKDDYKGGIGKYYLLRVNVTEKSYGFWEDDVRVNHQGSRILENDVVEFVGSVIGL